MSNFIPLVDLKAQLKSIGSEAKERIEQVINNCSFILGPEVEEFEKNFAYFTGAKEVISCGNGTDALYLACLALDLKAGDEVIIPAMTFAATALGASLVSAKPVLVDVEPHTALIDTSKIEAAITKTKAIIPVHLYGQMADMNKIHQIAKNTNLK